MTGNFSNGGVDTFDPDKGYVGLRMQQGVPLLDRDWNEFEDIRRHVERMLRQHYVGDGVPDVAGFAITPAPAGAEDEVLIGPGRCSVAGLEVENRIQVAFSVQGDEQPLPAPPESGDEGLDVTLYLEPVIERIDATGDPALANAQDINRETALRDRLSWAVRAVRAPDVAPADAYPLAVVHRAAGTAVVTADQIVDLRRTQLSLATTVDRMTSSEQREATVAAALEELRSTLEHVQGDLDLLFWQVQVHSGAVNAVFGQRVRIEAKVTNRRGDPIAGAVVAFSTDWGTLEPGLVTSGPNGVAAVDLVGVRNDVPMKIEDLPVLQRVTGKVQAAMVTRELVTSGPQVQAVDYARLNFEPAELGLISRYSPSGALLDIANDLPREPLVLEPVRRTATVTVHVKESTAESIVKAVGNIQVQFGLWIRDWARTKVWEMTEQLRVGARVGDIIRQGVNPETQELEHDRLLNKQFPEVLYEINHDTARIMKSTVFGDPDLGDDDLRGSGKLGQVIAEEATAAIGAKTQQAVATQIAHLVSTNVIAPESAATAQVRLDQGSAQIVAGMAQTHRQRFARVEG
jgi:hypothetical protein